MARRQRKTYGAVAAAFRWIGFIAGLLLLLVLGLYILGQQIRVQGSSMYPSLIEGDSLILDKVSYLVRRPKRGEIVVFSSRYQENTRFIKRIIALPGETVQIINGQVFVNGQQLAGEEDYPLISQPGLASRQITLAEEEYFVLGDNRNDSSDSREPAIGNVRLEEIEGRVLLRIWPLTRLGLI